MHHKLFLDSLDQDAVVAAITRAELRCSGEIRVHVQPRAWGGELRWVAERTFERLGMTKTELRNGVLIFIVTDDQKFVILGDRGIDEKVGEGFWNHIAQDLGASFHEHRFTEGLVAAIDEIGELLADHFPRRDEPFNELPDTISIEHERHPENRKQP